MQVLRTIWRTWKRFGQFLGDVIARIVLTIFYFTIFMPFGIGVRLLGDPLEIKRVHPSWSSKSNSNLQRDDARKLW